MSIRPAFQNCLATYYAADRDKLVLVPELAEAIQSRASLSPYLFVGPLTI